MREDSEAGSDRQEDVAGLVEEDVKLAGAREEDARQRASTEPSPKGSPQRKKAKQSLSQRFLLICAAEDPH